MLEKHPVANDKDGEGDREHEPGREVNTVSATAPLPASRPRLAETNVLICPQGRDGVHQHGS